MAYEHQILDLLTLFVDIFVHCPSYTSPVQTYSFWPNSDLNCFSQKNLPFSNIYDKMFWIIILLPPFDFIIHNGLWLVITKCRFLLTKALISTKVE